MSDVKKYRKKSLEREAVQWTGDNIDELKAFTADQGPIGSHMDAVHGHPTLSLYVAANGTWVPLEVGEWVIKEKAGYYPCKDAIFQATYDPVDA